MPRYEVLKGNVNGQLRRADGQGPPQEIYKFKVGEVFEARDFPKLSDQALEHLVKGGSIRTTSKKVTDRVAAGEIEREARSSGS